MSDNKNITIEQLAEKVNMLQDEYIKMKKMYEDLFYNLDMDNLSSKLRKDMNKFERTFTEVFPDGTVSTSTVAQTAQKISWLVASGDDISNFTLTNRVAQLVAKEINLTGFVTFASLEEEGETIINGGNIKTGVISWTRVAKPAKPMMYYDMFDMGHYMLTHPYLMDIVNNVMRTSINVMAMRDALAELGLFEKSMKKEE